MSRRTHVKSKGIIKIIYQLELIQLEGDRVFTLLDRQTHPSKPQQHLESAPKPLDLGLCL